MADRPAIAYFTSAYARAGDTFIRGEVQQLRALGFTIHTFSVRRSGAEELVSDDIRREQANTEYLLDGSKLALLGEALGQLVRRPGRMIRSLRLALRTSPPGLKSRLWAVAYWIEAARLARRLRAKNIRHLHNHIGRNSASIAMLASLLADVPYSLTIHGPGEFDMPLQLALGEKIRRAAFVVGVSHFGRSQLCRWVEHAHWPKIHVVHCGVDQTFLDHPPTPIPPNPRLVSVGRLAEQKGQLLLIEAADVLTRRGIPLELIIVGDGPMHGELRQLIADRNLGSVVKLAGWMNSQQVRDEILKSRALVLPSFAEGLPVALMEALALHRPVITTHIAGIPELVRPGENGWLFPAGSLDDLVTAMAEALAASTDQLEQMGRAGAARVAQQHNAATEAGKIARLIERSISR